MSFQISCPHCGKQLSARPELIGGKAACPSCARGFRIQAPDLDHSDDRAANATMPPPNPDLYPPGAAPIAKGSSTKSEVAVEAQPDSGRSGGGRSARRRTARFIQRDANATQIKMGADGRLPDLALQQREKRAESAERGSQSHPLLLIGVLCVSVVLSVLILLVEEPAPGVSGGKTAARQTVQATFDSWDPADPPDQEVRDLLARALQAYNQGDLREERHYYRQVMDRLNREDAPKYGGFTGDDETLQQALSELLR